MNSSETADANSSSSCYDRWLHGLCASCGTPLHWEGSICCSTICYQQLAQRFETARAQAGRECPWCQQPLTGSQTVACSVQCRDKIVQVERTMRTPRICMKCGKDLGESMKGSCRSCHHVQPLQLTLDGVRPLMERKPRSTLKVDGALIVQVFAVEIHSMRLGGQPDWRRHGEAKRPAVRTGLTEVAR